jgi:Plasma-membrane choline transporter
MGSICFGSLFIGPVTVIRQVSVLFRPNSDEASLLCLHECLHCIQACITSCVDKLSDHFNPWALSYIGLYGYGFLDAGHNATELFQKRGWTTIVSDDLVPNVLVMASLGIGGVTGCFGFFISGMDSLHVLSVDEPGVVSFATGLVIGLVLTSVLFGVISSSVNAVIVCFASSPLDFERNHPVLSHEMRSAWREVWPGALDMVDLRISLAMPSSPGGIPNSPGLHIPNMMV